MSPPDPALDPAHKPPIPPPADLRRMVLGIVLPYVVFSSAWILSSDYLLGLLFHANGSLQWAQSFKGLLFVIATGLLLLLLVQRFFHHTRPATQTADFTLGDDRERLVDRQGERWFLVGAVLVLTLLLSLLGGLAIVHNDRYYRSVVSEQLATIAELKERRIASWIEQKRNNAQLLQHLLLAPEAGGLSSATLPPRLAELRNALGYDGLGLVDGQGRILIAFGSFDAAPDAHLPAASLPALQAALGGSAVGVSAPFRQAVEGGEDSFFDWIVPIANSAEPLALVLRSATMRELEPMLNDWSKIAASLEILLFEPSDDGVQLLNRLRKPVAGPADRSASPASSASSTPASSTTSAAPPPGYEWVARAIGSAQASGSLLEGTDSRGVPVFAVAQPIEGTPWWLMVKKDRAESFAVAQREALWIGFAILVIWLAAVIGALFFFQQRNLRHAQALREQLVARLQALALIEAISTHSTDAIFAKDRQGRYLLFNPAAAKFIGRSSDEILGKDDYAIFPPEYAARFQEEDRKVMDNELQQTLEQEIPSPRGIRTTLVVKGVLRTREGQVIGTYGMARDITERASGEAQLAQRLAELERFNRAMIGRELVMVGLKREVNRLAEELGRPPPYVVEFARGEELPPEPTEP